MARSSLFADHPELATALSTTLHSVLAHSGGSGASSSSALAVAAEQLSLAAGSSSSSAPQASRPGARSRRMSAGDAGGSPGAADLDDEAADRIRQRAQARGRRGVVFSQPVKESDDWTPPVVEKSEAEKAQIESVIKANMLFGGIDEDTRRTLVDSMDRKSFAQGEVVIRQGDPGDFYYCIAEGTADVLVNDKVVLSLRAGQGFGELALLYDSPRAATIVATSGVLACWALDRTTFKHVTIASVSRKRRQYEEFLRAVPILSTLTKEEVLTVADALQSQAFGAGEVVVRQGDPNADRFYIVEAGELAATMDGVEGEVCARLTAGSYFGERALITDAPRAATVTAVVPSKCLAMDRAAFLRLLGPMADLLKRNMAVYDRYLS